MKAFHLVCASIACALTLAGQSVTAQDTPSSQDNSVENFAIAALKVEKAHVIEGIYYITQILPRQCHNPNIDIAVADFSSKNQELIARVNASPLFPMIRDGVEKASAAPKPPAQVDRECSKTFAVLKTFDSDLGKRNAARMLQTMKKEFVINTN